VIDAPEVLAFSGWDRLIIRVLGLTEGDSFDSFKMFKPELDDGAQATITEGITRGRRPGAAGLPQYVFVFIKEQEHEETQYRRAVRACRADWRGRDKGGY
jgi:hypothetical protein